MVKPLATRYAQDLMGREADAHRGLDGRWARFPLRISEDGKGLAGHGHQHLRGYRYAAVGPRNPEGLRLHIPLEDTYERLRKRL